MKILEYDDVDPVSVLDLNLLSLGYPLTPELVARIRHLDQRPFPFFGLYAVEGGTTAGQVLVYRLPGVTIEGPENLGAVAAVATHPAFSHRGIAAQLLEEAHTRMRSVGLRFSTLATARHRMAHLLYKRAGYEDMLAFGSAFKRFDPIQVSTGLRAELAGEKRLDFARRFEPFFPAIIQLGDLEVNNIWLLLDGDSLVGYAIAAFSKSILKVSDLLIDVKYDPASALAAILRTVNAKYIQARINHPAEQRSFQSSGFQIAQPAWGTFMVKPLLPEMTIPIAQRLLGIGTETFLISWLDIT
jgi:GNAT superfamily N-acetyltransferase